ncbi:MAG: DegV family protein [Clostridiales bacterium]|nr:DegV family protein [Clostridiales bacterium]
MAIHIITDSASDIDQAEAMEKGISMVPLSISIGDETYLDGVTLDNKQFYELLSSRKDTLPTTSQPSPMDFLACFEAAKANGDEVVAVLIASSLSGTFQSASIAQSMCGYDKIYLVDSGSAATGERLLVDVALSLRESGMDGKSISDQLEQLKGSVRLYAMVDTLEYLKRGGRISKTAASIGTLAKLKPIISFYSGTLSLAKKSLGIGRAIKELCNFMEQYPPDPRYPVYLPYSYNRDNSAKLLALVRERYPQLDIKGEFGLGCTIGTHVGPGAVGLVYISQP